VVAGLARSEEFLDPPYSGGRYDRWLDRGAVHSLLVRSATALAARRDPFGAWGSDLATGAPPGAPEASATALIAYALARGVNQGFLDRARTTPVVLKAFHTLVRLVDTDGDLHRIQPPAAGPGTELTASDDPDLNVSYGVGAFLMAAAEVSRLPAEALAGLETTEAVVVPRERFTHLDGRLVIPAGELGVAGPALAGAMAVGAISGQEICAAGYARDSGLVWVEDAGAGEVALFWAPPETSWPEFRILEERSR
jgi:hypothetical protein